ncbi:MAG: M20/M25/M40 family metallo-hydrolase, partial [Treponema sp.]|nr:M20/M25/M40 family metallo-hydrolase [Treponema sp.]
MKINKKYFRILGIVITLVAGILLSVLQTKPPRVNKSLPMYPVYERMMANLQKMAAKPHPSNSAEIKIVRAHLLEEIENMGIVPIIHDVIYTREELIDIFFLEENGVSSIEELWEKFHDFIIENRSINSLDELIEYKNNFEIEEIIEGIDEDGKIVLQNIMVKLDAPDTDRSVLFMAHYDSTPYGPTPGTADNMLSVVAILEALRSQAQNKTLKTNLYFLFSDGEEQHLTGRGGTEGTKRFVREYPELKDKIDMVISFEARGNRGALILFETSPNAYRLIEAYKKSG